MWFGRMRSSRTSRSSPTPHGVDVRSAAGVVCRAAKQRNSVTKRRRGGTMGASKRGQMRSFDDDWPDQIFSAARQVNDGKGAAWLLPLAAIAVTGCRPAALEKGVEFSVVKRGGKNAIQAKIQGTKMTENRGQEETIFTWSVHTDTHRPDELMALTKAIMAAPDRKLIVSYDAEAISTRLRELSTKLWPRRRNKITGYCYRELLSSTAKASGADAVELALAMGHRSTESQGAYARAGRVKTASGKPWGSVSGKVAVRTDRSPMARFKLATIMKKRVSP